MNLFENQYLAIKWPITVCATFINQNAKKCLHKISAATILNKNHAYLQRLRDPPHLCEKLEWCNYYWYYNRKIWRIRIVGLNTFKVRSSLIRPSTPHTTHITCLCSELCFWIQNFLVDRSTLVVVNDRSCNVEVPQLLHIFDNATQRILKYGEVSRL